MSVTTGALDLEGPESFLLLGSPTLSVAGKGFRHSPPQLRKLGVLGRKTDMSWVER